MSRRAVALTALAGVVVLAVVGMALDAITLAGVLAFVWGAAWAYRFWELR